MRQFVFLIFILASNSFLANTSFPEGLRYEVSAKRAKIGTSENGAPKITIPEGPGAWKTCPENIGQDQWRSRIIATSSRLWEVFGFQVFEFSASGLYRFPTRYNEQDEITYQVVDPVRNMRVLGKIPRVIRLGKLEDDRRLDKWIADFWAVVPRGGNVIKIQNNIFAEYPDAGWAHPWSAAFVSWVICESGITNKRFHRSPRHSSYVNQAIVAGSERDEDVAFWAVDPASYTPIPGDIICASRRGAKVTIQDRLNELKSISKKRGKPLKTLVEDQSVLRRAMHCDIVVKVDTERKVLYAIGGNVINSVSLTIVALDEIEVAGETQLRLRPTVGPTHERPWFAILKLRAPDIGSPQLESVDLGWRKQRGSMVVLCSLGYKWHV